MYRHVELVFCTQKSVLSQNFWSSIFLSLRKIISFFTIIVSNSIDRTTWFLIMCIPTQPTASTFLVYKHLNLVRILFVLRHCVPSIFIFLLSLQKKKNLQCSTS